MRQHVEATGEEVQGAGSLQDVDLVERSHDRLLILSVSACQRVWAGVGWARWRRSTVGSARSAGSRVWPSSRCARRNCLPSLTATTAVSAPPRRKKPVRGRSGWAGSPRRTSGLSASCLPLYCSVLSYWSDQKYGASRGSAGRPAIRRAARRPCARANVQCSCRRCVPVVCGRCARPGSSSPDDLRMSRLRSPLPQPAALPGLPAVLPTPRRRRTQPLLRGTHHPGRTHAQHRQHTRPQAIQHRRRHAMIRDVEDRHVRSYAHRHVS